MSFDETNLPSERNITFGEYLERNREKVDLLVETGKKEKRLFDPRMQDTEDEWSDIERLNENQLNPFRAAMFEFLNGFSQEDLKQLGKNEAIRNVEQLHRMTLVVLFRRFLEEEGNKFFTENMSSNDAASFWSVNMGTNFYPNIAANADVWEDTSNEAVLYYKQKLQETETELNVEPKEIIYDSAHAEDIEFAKKLEAIHYRLIQKGINVVVFG